LFFIVNKTKRKISINDLDITLGPRQATDLDKRLMRKQIDASKDLKNFNSRGIIEIKKKDDKVKKTKLKSKPSNAMDEKYLKNLKQEISDELKKTVNEMKEDLKEGISGINAGVSQGDLQSIVAQIVSAVKSEDFVDLDKIGVENPDIDMNTLSNIHAMAIGKLVDKSTVSNVDYKKEKSDKNSLKDNVSELENML
jgi:hypothetical protein